MNNIEGLIPKILLLLLLLPFIEAVLIVIVRPLEDSLVKMLLPIENKAPDKKLALVFVLAGLISWYLGDSKTSYNLFLVILGYLLFYMAYRAYKGFGNNGARKSSPSPQSSSDQKALVPKDTSETSYAGIDSEIETHWL